ncbi:tRNA-uridine aminocarboxypropyltransferase 1 isoform X2 [Anolis carolinensis]|uniref:tRNA-uridine aminocarboxypropyltransferase 1 isoform X2 n=1 Tax=Anolis carolinensis TaxID=28377 RepID=UPI002F2B3CEC
MSLMPPVTLKEDDNKSQGVERSSECLMTSQETAKEETPMDNLLLASQTILESAQKQGRSKCPRCHGSRMFYCYTCYVPVETVPTRDIPVVKLPLKIDIIKHPNETDGKSTAVHAKLLAPEDVMIYTYPCIPDYEEMRHEIALIFPGPNSILVNDIPLSLQSKCEKNVSSDKDGDSAMAPALKSARLESGLLQIELKSRKTCFWRHQKGKPDTYLSTIEAIYYFLVDYHKEFLKEKYEGQYDNLLFFFSFMYKLIRNARGSAGKE